MVDRFLKSESAASGATCSLNECFADKVAQYRNSVCTSKVQMLMDMMWGIWSGAFEKQFQHLAFRECSAAAAGSAPFQWHRHLSHSDDELSLTYRAFLAVCKVGPVIAAPGAAGAPESDETATWQEESKPVQESFLSLRRQSVNFVALPKFRGGLGQYTVPQLDRAWETMRLGHKFSAKNGKRRALVFSADLFPPNVTKHGRASGIAEQIAVDKERMKRTIDFMLRKRGKDDVVLLFDGRSRRCRKIMESFEDALAASGAHDVTEIWFVYMQPVKTMDPRVPGRSVNFAANTKESALCSWPRSSSSKDKVLARAEFNQCGETSTTSTSYTGIQMRRFGDLPRMNCETKVNIFGATTIDVEKGKERLKADIIQKGHPFSWAETKPMNLWQRMCEHFRVTHIVDFTPGSAGLAVAASGAMQYEGIAANEEHLQWLNFILDRHILSMVGRDKQVAANFG